MYATTTMRLDGPAMYSVADLPDVLNLPAEAVTEIIDEGLLPVAMIGGHKRVFAQDLVELLSELRPKGNQ